MTSLKFLDRFVLFFIYMTVSGGDLPATIFGLAYLFGPEIIEAIKVIRTPQGGL